ncbi:hypothetical protein [Bacillus cereus]|uniref:hypothetical protein n=1 Tax=Bacillus cereus TaxID=1396 RepID=UPI000BF9269B|nr:hypothetical protein [Bacillus cereus]PEY83091.1 hypothetical protein CN353_30915 [Bacillus cereus]PFA70834.1 hypothetical protein CN403_17680 [Bacillus cereus]PGV95951.1 hypothetical protein COD80_12535 [Bacillus cereus]PGY30265.1 hypothetical protein COE27_17305 [Bacillus cereus]
MEKVLDIFKHRIGKSLCSLFVMIMSIVAIFVFQKIRIETVKGFYSSIFNSQENLEMMWTLGINLLSLVFNIVMIWLWLKDMRKDNYVDMDPTTVRFVALIITIIHVIFSLVFITYIFSNLLGIVIGILIFAAIIWVFFKGIKRKRNKERK